MENIDNQNFAKLVKHFELNVDRQADNYTPAYLKTSLSKHILEVIVLAPDILLYWNIVCRLWSNRPLSRGGLGCFMIMRMKTRQFNHNNVAAMEVTIGHAWYTKPCNLLFNCCRNLWLDSFEMNKMYRMSSRLANESH